MTDSANQRNCLHLVVRSSIDAMERCRSQCTDEDAVVFLDDGVMHLSNGLLESFGSDLPEVCLSAVDLEARGLLPAALDAGATIVCDSDIAGLLLKYDFCMTWK
jgi:sulfur relay protein TusB/DsrH